MNQGTQNFWMNNKKQEQFKNYKENDYINFNKNALMMKRHSPNNGNIKLNTLNHEIVAPKRKFL